MNAMPEMKQLIKSPYTPEKFRGYAGKPSGAY